MSFQYSKRNKRMIMFFLIVIVTFYLDVQYVLKPRAELNNAEVSCQLVHMYPAVNEQTGKNSFTLKRPADYQCPGNKIVQGIVDPYRPPTELYGMYLLKQGDIEEVDPGIMFLATMYLVVATISSIVAFISWCIDDE